ncbi:sensor domain-containing diguanylate cyclase [Dokdonella sp.]|uniref:sensor domain-containing diguanylate cyclase n=1 Tax=Dokdonella sp. TaxID=2291710 RepID=UPI003C4C412C
MKRPASRIWNRPQAGYGACLLAILGIWLLLASAAEAAVQPVVLKPAQEIVALAPGTEYLVDSDSSASAEDVFRRISSNDFKPLPHGNATFGFVDGSYWFHVRLINENPLAHRRVLVLGYVLLDEIDVYVRRADGSISHAASGDFRPFSDRAYSYREPNFNVALADFEQADLLVRVRSKSSMQVPLTLYTQRAFFELARDSQFSVGIYYGILLALLFYNLILFFTLRDWNYFFYVLHVTGTGLVLFCLNGLAFEFLWPQSPWLANVAIPMSLSLAMLCMHQFVRCFLDLRTRLPAGNRVLLGFVAFYAVMLVLSMFVDYRIAVWVGTAAVFPGTAAILVISVVLVRRGDVAARIFLFAWSMLLVGATAYAMVSFGLLPQVWMTEYGIQLGSALEMILLSFALAYRFVVLREENVRIVQSARDELEHRVGERTRELSTTLSELAIANDRLRESSLRDGLTGVYNRRYLDGAFESMVAECRTRSRSLAVLVADIDHFKRVNDEAGHLVGDDCLRMVADLIEKLVGADGSVVRYGGEEFVVILPGFDKTATRGLAESIRIKLAESPLLSQGERLHLTISIGGVVSMAGENDSAMDLLQRADAAMYQAKNDGRNRVVVA